MRPVQYFSDDYLQQCKDAKPEAILDYLENFRLMSSEPSKSKLISMKIPENLLKSFRTRCELENIRYQTKIKKLMEEWLQGN
jgi:predicted DNA binding CopG/RHH family protein